MPLNACTNYPNALWLILITTSTVGYGDYVPQTPLGRIIILFVAIWGTLIVSIMVVVVGNTLNMEKTEVKTSRILNKLEMREEMEKKAEKFIGYFLMNCLKRNEADHLKLFAKMKKAKK